jgi:hypothetical protein
MRRLPIAIACTAVAAGLLGTASAGAATSASASCVGIITSAEGSQLPPGSVGREVPGLARNVPRLGLALVSPLAHEHGGNCA